MSKWNAPGRNAVSLKGSIGCKVRVPGQGLQAFYLPSLIHDVESEILIIDLSPSLGEESYKSDKTLSEPHDDHC